MTLALRSCLATAAVAASLLTAGAALAQGTWNLGAAGTQTTNPIDYCSPQTSGALQGNAQCTAQGSGASGINATMYAFSNTGTNGAFVNTGLVSYDPLGFGTISGSNESGYSGQHAFDNQTTNCGQSSGTATNTNCGGSVELMLINFSSAVKLTAIDFSWKDSAGGVFATDADFSVYRADGPPATNPALGAVTNAAATTSTSLGAGWTLVGSADMLQQGVDKLNPNTGGSTGIAATNAKELTVDTVAGGAGNNNLYSSWWVISTYFGANSGMLTTGNDAFKILSFAATGCSGTVGSNGVCTAGKPVPEPATLALVSMALVGAGWVARRRSASMRTQH